MPKNVNIPDPMAEVVAAAPKTSPRPGGDPKPPRLSVDITTELDDALAMAKQRTKKTIRTLTLEALAMHPDIKEAAAILAEVARMSGDDTAK